MCSIFLYELVNIILIFMCVYMTTNNEPETDDPGCKQYKKIYIYIFKKLTSTHTEFYTLNCQSCCVIHLL